MYHVKEKNSFNFRSNLKACNDLVGWLVDLGLTALLDSISVYIGPPPREREKEERNDRQEKKCPNNPTRTYSKCSRPLPYSYPNACNDGLYVHVCTYVDLSHY